MVRDINAFLDRVMQRRASSRFLWSIRISHQHSAVSMRVSRQNRDTPDRCTAARTRQSEVQAARSNIFEKISNGNRWKSIGMGETGGGVFLCP